MQEGSVEMTRRFLHCKQILNQLSHKRCRGKFKSWANACLLTR